MTGTSAALVPSLLLGLAVTGCAQHPGTLTSLDIQPVRR